LAAITVTERCANEKLAAIFRQAKLRRNALDGRFLPTDILNALRGLCAQAYTALRDRLDR